MRHLKREIDSRAILAWLVKFRGFKGFCGGGGIELTVLNRWFNSEPNKGLPLTRSLASRNTGIGDWVDGRA